MQTRKRRRSRTVASAGSALMLAPSVAIMRLPLMAMDGPSWSLESEAVRAVNEKTIALVVGTFAAQVSLLKSALRFWPEVFSGRTPSLFNGVAAEHSIYAALEPASRRVQINFERLSKKA